MITEEQIKNLRMMGLKHLKDRIAYLEANADRLKIDRAMIVRNKAEKVKKDKFIKDTYGITIRA